MQNNSMIFIANVDKTKNNGAAEHIKCFINAVEETCGCTSAITSDTVKIGERALLSYTKAVQLLFFNIASASSVIRNRETYKIVYLRYSPFILLPILVARILGKVCYIELNGNVDNEVLELFHASIVLRIMVFLSNFVAFLAAERIVTVTFGLKNYYEKRYFVCRGKIRTVSNAGESGLKKRNKGIVRRGVYISSDIFWSSFDYAEKLQAILKKENINMEILGKKGNDNDRFKGGDYDFGLIVFNEKSRKLLDGVSPIKYFTYLAHGIPVVTPDLPDINALTVKKRVGVVYKNKYEISEKILELYNDLDYEQISERAYQFIQEECNWKNKLREILVWKVK